MKQQNIQKLPPNGIQRLACDDPVYQKVMSYKNDELVLRFASKFGLSLIVSNDIFCELKKWLYLVGRYPKHNFEPIIWSCMNIVDEMWHEFILFTQDYDIFCNEHFGHFIHHLPTPQAEKARIREAIRNGNLEERHRQKQSMASLIEAVINIFDMTTAEKWFREFKNDFSKTKINTMLRDSLNISLSKTT